MTEFGRDNKFALRLYMMIGENEVREALRRGIKRSRGS